MSVRLPFNEVKEKYFRTLAQYVPIVARVHGVSHPEFHEVRKYFDLIVLKTADAGEGKPELNEEFSKLREITNNYTVPDDVCESYEAVYNILSELDKAYYS
ncbi:MAG: iron-sulfur cluster repair di-iron protein, ric [Clostridiaceae bacterium]|nr:iron-sulfur cluster repair di-iron protein, ric [Clostridiaceae bacterium]